MRWVAFEAILVGMRWVASEAMVLRDEQGWACEEEKRMNLTLSGHRTLKRSVERKGHRMW